MYTSFSSKDNYSLLHNYSYENKSDFVELLDQVSSLWREPLGGVNIHFRTKSLDCSKKRLILKIMGLALLTFFAPKFGCLVAAVSLASLGIKAVFLKISTELNKINAEFIEDEFHSEKTSDEKKIDLFNNYDFLRNKESNQPRFAATVERRYASKQISLNDAAELLSLISNKKIITQRICGILSLYLSDFHGAPYLLPEFFKLINAPLKGNVESIKACCLRILEEHKITKEIDMSDAFLWELKHVLLIEDVVTLLEENEVKNLRESAFTKVKHYNPLEKENIRKFLTILATLKKETENLTKSVQEMDGFPDFKEAFEKLIKIAGIMLFPNYASLSELKKQMTMLLTARRVNDPDRAQGLKEVKEVCQQMPTSKSSINIGLTNAKRKGGFNLGVYYMREHDKLSTCFMKAANSLF